MVLSEEHPRVIRYRSPEPVLTPDLPQERRGTVANVVFPTGIDRRDDLGIAGPLRRLLRDGRRPDRRGAPRPAGSPAYRGSRRQPGIKLYLSPVESVQGHLGHGAENGHHCSKAFLNQMMPSCANVACIAHGSIAYQIATRYVPATIGVSVIVRATH